MVKHNTTGWLGVWVLSDLISRELENQTLRKSELVSRCGLVFLTLLSNRAGLQVFVKLEMNVAVVLGFL